MNKSTKWIRTRGNDRGMNMDISHFHAQFEETPLYERIDMDNYNRSVIKNYGPDRILFPDEEPRRDNHSRWVLNLHHTGAKDPTLPYRNDDFDIQFRDKDPRGYLEEQDWKKYRANNEPKLRQRLFGVDSDNSVVGQGIAPVDMVNRLSRLRRELRGRIQWFDESLDNIVTGRSGKHANSPGRIGGGQIDLIIPEDSSATVDPTILDSIGRQNVNRLVSNNLHIGSKYFTERSIPDHVVPVASYGFLFKSYAPMTPIAQSNMIIGDQPIRRLNDKTSQRNFIQLLDNKTDNSISEQSRFNKMFETQEANNHGVMLNRDIMALLGITINEIDYIKSMEGSNREAHRQCLANVIDMVIALDKLPPNAKLDIRTQLLEARTPEFMGGMCKLSIQDHNIKNILNSRTRTNIVNNRLVGGVSDLVAQDNKFGLSVSTGNKEHSNISNNRSEIINEQKYSESNKTSNKKNINDNRSGGVDKNVKHEPTASYSHVFKNRKINNKINMKPATNTTTGTYSDSKATYVKNRVVKGYRLTDTACDTDMGVEHEVQGELKSWNDSHLIPRQYRVRSGKR